MFKYSFHFILQLWVLIIGSIEKSMFVNISPLQVHFHMRFKTLTLKRLGGQFDRLWFFHKCLFRRETKALLYNFWYCHKSKCSWKFHWTSSSCSTSPASLKFKYESNCSRKVDHLGDFNYNFWVEFLIKILFIYLWNKFLFNCNLGGWLGRRERDSKSTHYPMLVISKYLKCLQKTRIQIDSLYFE